MLVDSSISETTTKNISAVQRLFSRLPDDLFWHVIAFSGLREFFILDGLRGFKKLTKEDKNFRALEAVDQLQKRCFNFSKYRRIDNAISLKENPFYLLAKGEHIDALQKLDARVLLQQERERFLFWAARQGDVGVIHTMHKNRICLRILSKEDWTLATVAAACNQARTIEALAMYGLNINMADKMKNVPLEIAIQRKHLEVISVIFEYYKKVAEKGDISAQNDLGVMYRCGHGCEIDYQKAMHWFMEAANYGHAEAQYNLGLMYRFGLGCEQNYKKTIFWFMQAAQHGNTVAQRNLGLMYRCGEGVQKNFQLAISWFTKAAEAGDAQSQYNLGAMYYIEEGCKKNMHKSFDLYRKSAMQGYAVAQNNLGVMCKNGYGCKKDHDRAIYWFIKAAEQGYAAAQYNLGSMYKMGLGCKRNPKEAFVLYEKAANQGLVDAIEELHPSCVIS